MREKDEPQFRIEGFSEDSEIRKKQIDELIKKRDKIFKELRRKKEEKER